MIGVFYRAMHLAYREIFGRQHMLHYPLFKEPNQDLMAGQIHFTEYCIEHLPVLAGKDLLDIGCGNGVQTIHIHRVFQPASTLGIDLSPIHVKIASDEAAKLGLQRIEFRADNAQRLSTAADASVDIVICTESAHHYPDKNAFLTQVRRVMRPGSWILIADLLCRPGKPPNWLNHRLYLYYWSREEYRMAFARLGFQLEHDEDLTPLVLRSFRNADRWFPSTTHSGLSYRLAKAFGRFLIRLYVKQLTHSLQYQLMVARSTSVVRHAEGTAEALGAR